MKIRIISWNVAGIRACVKKGLWEFIAKDNGDIYCFQEIKAKIDQIPNDLEKPRGFFEYWNPAERPGYSGVGVMSKIEPRVVINGEQDNDWDNEGRVVVVKYDEFTLINCYFPNGKRDLGRLEYKLKFYKKFLRYINGLRKNGEKVIFCGDINTAHTEIDLANPGANKKTSGFLPIERDWIDELIKNNWIDTFRLFNKEPNNYSWWSQMGGARARNIGWRIDYFFVDKAIKSWVKKAFILPDQLGSDHCPVGVEVEI